METSVWFIANKLKLKETMVYNFKFASIKIAAKSNVLAANMIRLKLLVMILLDFVHLNMEDVVDWLLQKLLLKANLYANVFNLGTVLNAKGME